MKNNHPFHLVTSSPWPILASLSVFNLVFSVADLFMTKETFNLFVSILSLMLIKFQWWRDITREGLIKGDHTSEVMKGLQIGMVLFITSEVFFFLSFFWAFFHAALSPDIFIGAMWPCKGIETFSPLSIPLLNTIILLSSGVLVTWCHHLFQYGNMKNAQISLLLTCILGVYFVIMQWVEYKEASFTISDSIYGTTFFLSTGFHGLHVIIGTLFLIICLIRLFKKEFSSNHFVGFEAAAWYWHFVDVVWLFLYLFIYWWSS
uniref:Cytochrome c oxidase subunit 3 n=1 Tax=Franklinothrips vespiformis TaxID=297892 RepID=A0A8A5L5D9_FRAVS|nr:cytochrome c oxidase subunit 3 [Franklinothrips vespiformis]